MNGMEKRYFRLAVSVHGKTDERNYMRLFDAISQQKIYDEAALRKELHGEEMLKRFDMSKNYLYRLVLNTLQNYHRHSSMEERLMNMLNRAVILHNKLLYKSCSEQLEKAGQTALQFEYYEIYLQIIQMKIRVAMAEKKDVRHTDPLHAEHGKALARISRINEYRKQYHKLYTFFGKKGNDLRVEGLKNQYAKFLKHPLLSGKIKPEGYEQSNYFYLIQGLCYFCMGNSEKSYHFTQQQLKLIQQHPHRIKEDPETYITALNSVIFYGSALGKISELEKVFHELEEFLKGYPSKQHKIFIAYDNMMALYVTAGLFREGLVYADRVKGELKNFEEKLFDSNKVSLYHDMFCIYFGCRKYEQSLEWLNRLLNETGLEVREDIQVTARLTNLILHYELKNFDLLPYLLRRTYSFLNKRRRLNKLEKTLLQFVNKLLRVSSQNKREIIELFREIKAAMEELTRKPDEARILTEYFDYIGWLESKIENRSFEKIVRDKALKNLKSLK
jgi:tetratricopeptide (TPR) repeat protein